jgi:hypothetical protein
MGNDEKVDKKNKFKKKMIMKIKRKIIKKVKKKKIERMKKKYEIKNLGRRVMIFKKMWG